LKNILFSLFFLLLFASIVTAGEPWKLIKEENGIRVYTKIDTKTSIKIVKAESEATTTLCTLFMLIKDAKNQPNWVFGCKSAEILKIVDRTHWYYYSQTDAPWPVSDRDVITSVHVVQDTTTKTITVISTAIPNYIPKNPGFVRIPELVSYWIFKPKPSGKIDITFQIKINIGGIIPQWVTNLFVYKGPYNTIRNLLFEIEKPKYKEAECPTILAAE